MRAAVEADRELLLATMRRHADELSAQALFALAAAADEMVDPFVTPALLVVDAAATVDLLDVVVAVRRRLDEVVASTSMTAEAMACARASRELVTVERALLGSSPR
jgi:hypothetical protein